MDFQLDDEQTLLRDTTRNLLTRAYDTETRNRVVDSEPGYTPAVWQQLAETGILGLGFDADSGGQLEIMVVLTEIGRTLAPNRCGRGTGARRAHRRTRHPGSTRPARRGRRRVAAAGVRPHRARHAGADRDGEHHRHPRR